MNLAVAQDWGMGVVWNDCFYVCQVDVSGLVRGLAGEENLGVETDWPDWGLHLELVRGLKVKLRLLRASGEAAYFKLSADNLVYRSHSIRMSPAPT